MGVVGGSVIRRIVQAGTGPETPAELLASVGLPPEVDPAGALQEFVGADAYYDLIERMAGPADHAFPFRYAEGFVPDAMGALGLAMKTAGTVGDALQRLVRYILVLTDTLEYELVEEPGGRRIVLVGRPHHRRGARLANECALGAITSFLRAAVGTRVVPTAVSFRHARPASDQPHHDFFGCPVRFGEPDDAVHLDHRLLATRTRLADEGLSAYLLHQLDDLHRRMGERSVVAQVRSAVTDHLPDGVPSRATVARRLALSERTLHRRLAEEGVSYQQLANEARQEAAEALLADDRHTLTDVAYLTGFGDQSAFTRAFKRWTGQTPQAYRRAT